MNSDFSNSFLGQQDHFRVIFDGAALHQMSSFSSICAAIIARSKVKLDFGAFIIDINREKTDMLDPRDVVALITDEKGNGCGTGFAIHRDDVGIYILTCAHVLHQLGEKVKVDGCYAKLIAPQYEDLEDYLSFKDLAILRINIDEAEGLNLPILQLVDTDELSSPLTTAGYSKLLRETRESIAIQGRLRTQVGWTQVREEAFENFTAWSFEPQRGNELKRGYSGAPIITEGNKVVGVLSHSGDNNEGRVIPIRVLLDVWPGIPNNLIELSNKLGEGIGPRGFICGRSLGPDELVGRTRVLDETFDLMFKSESVILYGESRSGKTSLVKKIVDKDTHLYYKDFYEEDKAILTPNIPLILNRESTTETFWFFLLDKLAYLVPKKDYKFHNLVKESKANASYKLSDIESIFNHLGTSHYVTFVVDEFERILDHPNFRTLTFYSELRRLTDNKYVSFIITSPYSKSMLVKRTRSIPNSPLGSSFFNPFTQIFVSGLEPRGVDSLLQRGGSYFSEKDIKFIKLTAGHQPYLLQLMADSLIKEIKKSCSNCYGEAADSFFRKDKAIGYYNDLWKTLDDNERVTLVVVGLIDLVRQLGNNLRFFENRIEGYKIHSCLRKLSRRGLLRKIGPIHSPYVLPWQRIAVWRDESWVIDAQAFVWWIWETFIRQNNNDLITYTLSKNGNLKRLDHYCEWVEYYFTEKKEYEVVITPEVWQELITKARRVSRNSSYGIEHLAKILGENFQHE